mmetsp:Transcript_25885/g.88571  ORF Transcript_25885/g.88571 Transcript_25885/m.88571 type:complete len:249 (-) Transcript_25885:26-772(-)
MIWPGSSTLAYMLYTWLASSASALASSPNTFRAAGLRHSSSCAATRSAAPPTASARLPVPYPSTRRKIMSASLPPMPNHCCSLGSAPTWRKRRSLSTSLSQRQLQNHRESLWIRHGMGISAAAPSTGTLSPYTPHSSTRMGGSSPLSTVRSCSRVEARRSSIVAAHVSPGIDTSTATSLAAAGARGPTPWHMVIAGLDGPRFERASAADDRLCGRVSARRARAVGRVALTLGAGTIAAHTLSRAAEVR